MFKIYKNYLQQDVAEYLYSKVLNTPPHWWFHSHRFSPHNKPIHYNSTLKGQIKIKNIEKDFNTSFLKNNYTYRFHRSLPHNPGCKCYECSFRENYLESTKFKSFVEKEIGLFNIKIVEQFISLYYPGDFLTTHNDQNRDVAFIFNLSKDWRPEYGGLLHIQNEDGTFTAINPDFNSLVLIPLHGKGKPHFVSEVSALAPAPRIAISGWYNSSDT